jgi:hypothetical protein
MSISKDNGLRKREIIKNLLFNEKIGSAIQLWGGSGYKYFGLQIVKLTNKSLLCFKLIRGWYSYGLSEVYQKAAVKITKDGFYIYNHCSYNFDNIMNSFGPYSTVIRALVSTGIIYNTDIRSLRGKTLINCNGEEVLTFANLSISWNGNLLKRPPKAALDETKKLFQTDKNIRNRHRKSNYHNKKVTDLLTIAKLSNKESDWNKLKPLDVFYLHNTADRTFLINHFGINKILNDMEHSVIDEETINGNKYQLLRFLVPNDKWANNGSETKPATYLKMINPSTGEDCIEGVPNNKDHEWNTRNINMNSVVEALAWRDRDSSYIIPTKLT